MLSAVNDYILQFTDVVQDNLFRGYQNRSTLPQTDDYTMYYMGGSQRIGTNVNEYEETQTSQTAKINTLQEYTVNIDFCGSNQETVENRAKTLAVLGRSYASCDFFKQYGINFNFADDVQNLPFTDEEDQFVHRCRIVLHLTRWDNVTINQPSADTVVVDKIVNVDVAYPPQ